MRKPSKKAKIIAARLASVQSIYQMALSGMTSKQAYDYYVDSLMGKSMDDDEYVPADLDLYADIVNGVSERRDDLREMVLGALNGKKPEPLLQSILFCGIYELLVHNDIDTPIIINDYVNVAHGFYDQAEANLVNAVLDHQSKNLRV